MSTNLKHQALNFETMNKLFQVEEELDKLLTQEGVIIVNLDIQ